MEIVINVTGLWWSICRQQTNDPARVSDRESCPTTKARSAEARRQASSEWKVLEMVVCRELRDGGTSPGKRDGEASWKTVMNRRRPALQPNLTLRIPHLGLGGGFYEIDVAHGGSGVAWPAAAAGTLLALETSSSAGGGVGGPRAACRANGCWQFVAHGG